MSDIASNAAARNSSLVEYALQYAGRGWRVFPLQGKVPFKGTKGFKDASTDPAAVQAWWARWPHANIGLATGAGLVVLDIDGPEGLAELQALVAQHGPLPRTLSSYTGTGGHAFFATGPDVGLQIRSRATGKLHVRGAGGYVVLPPSLHPNGRRYAWVDPVSEDGRERPFAATLAPLPDWLRQWMLTAGNPNENRPAPVQRTALPTHLQARQPRNIAERAIRAIKQAESTFSRAEFDRIRSALAVIPAVSYDIWYKVGFILKDLQWVRGDGTDIGFELWDEWSARVDSKYPGVEALEAKWQTFRGSGLGLGSLFQWARERGWKEVMPSESKQQSTAARPQLDSGPAGAKSHGTHERVNGHAAASATLPPEFSQADHAIVMPDVDKWGRFKSTCRNARGALQLLGIECEYDLFAEQPLIYGAPVQQYEGSMSDPAILVLRQRIEERWNFDPGGEKTRDAALQEAYAHSFNPVLDYLDALTWDGHARLATWLQRYLGADGTKINAEIGTKMLVAAVRRARAPGTKFDQLVVLEGKQGTGKSTALKILARQPEHYSDQSVLAVADREQQEALRGVWIHEISELTGINRAAVDKIKHFLSRTEDRARPAFGHFRVDLKRHGICVGTTNVDTYLKDETGNRRFWPVMTRSIDTGALAIDCDQLWAEAVALERRGYSIELDRKLWDAIGELQDERTEHDPWFDAIATHCDKLADVSINEIWTGSQFKKDISDLHQGHQNRIARALKQLGFTRRRESVGSRSWRYRKWDESPSGTESETEKIQ